jgi:hypothetical protein
MKAGDLYTHKDGNVYTILGIQKVTNTFEQFNNAGQGWSVAKQVKVTTKLVWYASIHNEMEVYCRTMQHFLESFTEGVSKPIIQPEKYRPVEDPRALLCPICDERGPE